MNRDVAGKDVHPHSFTNRSVNQGDFVYKFNLNVSAFSPVHFLSSGYFDSADILSFFKKILTIHLIVL